MSTPKASEETNKKSSLPDTSEVANLNEYSRTPIDLILFPDENKTFAGFSYSSTVLRYKVDYQTTEYLDAEIRSTELDVAVMHSLDDYWAIGVSVEQLFSSKSEVTYGPGSTRNGETSESKSSGLSDPSFSVTYRIMDVSRDRYDMNLTFDYSPKMQEAKGATSNTNGNNAKGGDTFSIGATWGRRSVDSSWAFGVTLNSYGESKSKDPDDGDITKVESYSTLGLTGSWQWIVSKKLAWDLGIFYGSSGEYRITFDDGSYNDYDSATIFSIGGTANITVGNKKYITAGITSSAMGERSIKSSSNITLTDTDRAAGTFSLGFVAEI